jgi:hypothetical protein
MNTLYHGDYLRVLSEHMMAAGKVEKDGPKQGELGI